MGMRDRRLLTGHIDDATLAALLDEVTDAVLRQRFCTLPMRPPPQTSMWHQPRRG